MQPALALGVVGDRRWRALSWRSLVAAMHEHRANLKIAFRYYTLIGANAVQEIGDTMTEAQFLNCVKSAGVIRKNQKPRRSMDRGNRSMFRQMCLDRIW